MNKINDVKVIAHRGWSAGKEENTINAFIKAYDKGVCGVEFDVRWASDKKLPIVSHDPSEHKNALCLNECIEFLSSTQFDLYIEMKEHDEELFSEVIKLLEKFNLKERTLVFGFKHVAESFPWGDTDVSLGIITKYPWHIKKDVKRFQPDFVLTGWDYRWWTRPVFKFMWATAFSMKRFAKKHDGVKFVAGIAMSKGDYKWLAKRKGLHACTVDKPFDW